MRLDTSVTETEDAGLHEQNRVAQTSTSNERQMFRRITLVLQRRCPHASFRIKGVAKNRLVVTSESLHCHCEWITNAKNVLLESGVTGRAVMTRSL
jgi:hypothetical protein